MKISGLVSLLNKKVPFRLCEKWDNVGFIAGDASGELTGVTAVLDLTAEAVDHAVETGANLIIAHHPLIFSPISNVRADNPVGSLLIKLIRSGVSLAVLHTNFDKSVYNQSYGIAEKLGLKSVAPLSATNAEQLCKLTVFVPPADCAALKKALSDAGAGVIGNYSQCAYMTDGYGEFMGDENSNPAVGEPLKLERTRETRLEMVFGEQLIPAVTEALLKNHPYEEPAYDICQLKNTFKNYGYGVYGELAEKTAPKKFVEKLKKIMSSGGAKPCFAAVGRAPETIRRVAIVNGSGFDFYRNAIEKKCDVFITGDVSYHRAMELAAAGLYTIDCSHFATESNFPERLGLLIAEIEKENKCSINYSYSDKIQKNPMESI